MNTPPPLARQIAARYRTALCEISLWKHIIISDESGYCHLRLNTLRVKVLHLQLSILLKCEPACSVSPNSGAVGSRLSPQYRSA